MTATDTPRWQFWIDRGGTFTDIVARRPDGSIVTHKLLSENPARYADAALAGMRALLGVPPGAPLPANLIDAVKMGTTIATNALLERKGEPTALLITRGLRDQLRIGYQNRPRIFDRHIVLPGALHDAVYEVDERLSARGDVLVPLDTARARAVLARAHAQGFRSVAIVLMHGYRYPAHEAELARMAREIGFAQVSASHEVSPLVKIVARGDTTVADAYLSPVLRRYVDRVAAELPGVPLQFMQSSGGLTDARRFQGRDSVLSGPAGGVVGVVRTAQAAGFERVIGFDMGGTSTDVSHFNGAFERAFDSVVAGVRIRAPMMSIHTVAAGGGSILHFDGTRCRVGPDSAGAQPGPACYRSGGPLTVTDANVMLGRIQPEFFPRVFGGDANQPLDASVVGERFRELAQRIGAATGEHRSAHAVAEGFVRIAVDNMANAIRKISVERGHDITRYTLCCFGGAAGQHACLVADALAMPRVYIHPHAGVLSAYGMGLADVGTVLTESVEAVLETAAVPRLDATVARLAASGRAELARQGLPAERVAVATTAHLRYEGTDTAVAVEYGSFADIVARFETTYRRQFSFLMPGRRLVVASLSLEATVAGTPPAEPVPAGSRNGPLIPARVVRTYAGDRHHDTPVFRREDLRPGDRLPGPAIIAEATATTVVEPQWQAEVTAANHLVLSRAAPRPERTALGTAADPVMLEIFNNLFMSIAEQMGVTLANTASSVNIKERLDFSCALFDAAGDLIANAPHLPVHLGAMSESVRAVARAHAGHMEPGDSFALNDPYHGGTHLPDVTVVTPVFRSQLDAAPATAAAGGPDRVLFYVACRGHHADIGGITPGSMPPHSRHLDEEGVLIGNFRLVERGRFRDEDLKKLLAGARYPARDIDQNLADLRAMVAANQKGVVEIERAVGQFGLPVVQAYMQHVQDNAEESVRRVIDVLRDGEFHYEMDNGAVIRVRIEIDRATRGATIDFSGTSPQLADNFNAPAAVTLSAVLYVFRTLVAADIPLNAGCLKPIRVIIPAGSMLNPAYPAAVVAGNVETSQCVTDALYGVMGVMGAAQGTMNNFTFGNERYQYYETICGGSGAGVLTPGGSDGFDGTDCVHTHMTNTRLTDPEILEGRYPVLLESFSIRTGSGGDGRWRGGNGAIRRIRFLEPMTAAILSGHRRIPPYGMAGGRSGQTGRNAVQRADGTVTELGSCARIDVAAGDAFIIETPGGGGYGAKCIAGETSGSRRPG